MAEPVDRFLTPTEKQEVLREWAEKRQVSRPASDPGGHGWPDPEIFPLCVSLNALPGVCTLQSCAGHRAVESGKGQTFPSSGHLWLRLDEDNTREFEKQVFALYAEKDLIESVSKIYFDSEAGHEIIAIAFAGNERDRLAQSASLILGFFASLHGGDDG